MSRLELSARIVDRNPGTVRIRVFQNGADAGTLVIEAKFANQLARFLRFGLDEIERLKGEPADARA